MQFEWYRGYFVDQRLVSNYFETRLENTIPAVPLKLHSPAVPLFGLQQALGIYAAYTNIPTGKALGISARKGWDFQRLFTGLPPTPALYEMLC